MECNDNFLFLPMSSDKIYLLLQIYVYHYIFHELYSFSMTCVILCMLSSYLNAFMHIMPFSPKFSFCMRLMLIFRLGVFDLVKMIKHLESNYFLEFK